MSPPTMKQVIEMFHRYSALALPLRLLLGAVVTLVAGTGIGFVAEYAAYRWALYYGLRPPLEGIPYLKVAVAGLTVAILVGGALVFGIAHFVASALLYNLENLIGNIKGYTALVVRIAGEFDTSSLMDALVHRYKLASFKLAATISVGTGLVLAAATYFHANTQPTSGDNPAVLASAVFAVTIISMLLLWNETVKIWFSLLAVLAAVLVPPAALFHIESYGALLRILGYGGGLPVEVVVVEDPDDQRNRTRLSGNLMLRTASALLVYEPAAKRVREVPLQQVLFLDHAAAPLDQRHPTLPW